MKDHLSIIQEKQKKRYALLLKAWEAAEYTENREVPFNPIKEEFGWNDDDERDLIQYLRAEGLLLWNNGRVYLSHKGVVELEQSIANPQKSTEHFQAQVIQHFHGAVGAVQNAPTSSAKVTLNPNSDDDL